MEVTENERCFFTFYLIIIHSYNMTLLIAFTEDIRQTLSGYFELCTMTEIKTYS